MKLDPAILAAMTDDERAQLDELLLADIDAKPWVPFPDSPQQHAYDTEADIVGYGGAAGGGKSDLILGTTVTQHERALIMRREKAQTEGLVQRLTEILGNTDGYASQRSAWQVRVGSKPLIEFGGLDNPGDERRWQGRPHDLLALDEVTEMREHQVRFLLGWVRSSSSEVRTRVLMTFNPPTTLEGRWVLDFFAPWLSRKHPNPAKPGELRWFTTIAGVDIEVPDARPFVLVDDDEAGAPQRVYDFDPAGYQPEDVITPKSRTFFPARVTDNPVYMQTGYVAQLQGLPEPLRSQMLYGDFDAGVEDDQWQVIPTAWVEAAMARWKPRDIKTPMDSMGVDVAMKGKDNTVIVRRHGEWFDEPIVHPGTECTDGPTIASFVIRAQRDGAVIHIDLFGVGAQPYGHLMHAHQQVIGVNVGEPAHTLDASGRLGFANLRSELWWRMREALDPASNRGLALPPNRQLLADLCTPKWKPVGAKVKVQSREEIIKTLLRSPDYGSACVLALLDTPKMRVLQAIDKARNRARPYDPLAQF